MTDNIPATPPPIKPLVYEETPIIEPLPEPAILQTPPKKTAPRRRILPLIGELVFFLVLFFAGLYLSTQIKNIFFPNKTAKNSGNNSGFSAVVKQSPTPTPGLTIKTYPIIDGYTRSPIDALTYQLPSNIIGPLCDGGKCPSVGTNLPGLTRFTVAPRGSDQELPDFRGAILTDATGKEFAMKDIPLLGVTVTEYTAEFTGQTGGGFTFTRMRGVLVPVSDSLSIEFNHFSPLGISTDFAADDLLFNQVVASFVTSLSAHKNESILNMYKAMKDS